MNKTPIRLYCDMDGVLCNFDARFEHFTGMSPKEYENSKKEKYGERKGEELFWDLIDNKIGTIFWSDMPWTPKGKELWNYINKHTPELLTSPSKHETSRLGKKLWVRKNLSPLPKVNFKYSQEKHQLATPEAVLIDDREDIIDNWIKAGGIGIHHSKNTLSIEEVLQQLKKLGI
jgi:hypothetical protein